MKIKLEWNKELKKLAAGFFVILMIGLTVLNLSIGIYADRIRTDYNNLLAAVFGNVISTYPEVSEDELIQILVDPKNRDIGDNIFKRYGIYDEYGADSFSQQESRIQFLSLFMNLFFLLFFLTLGMILFFYLGKRQYGIFRLESYMEALNREGYKLDLEDNEDDELSGLRNEIYKLTVMLKEQAARADEQKRILADSVADISHQLKTPLTSITVLVDNLSEDNDMDPVTRQHFLSEVVYQLTAMSWLITTMLKISRLDAGVVELERKRMSVSALVDEVLQKVEVAAEWNDISFSLEISREIEIYADRKWTAEALANIVKNAVEHSPRGASVKISAEENDVYTRISVRDFGEGITEEQQKKLFCRFYNGASAREDSIGLGLALAKDIVEKQRGYITVDSVRGKGTKFVIKFIK